MNKIIVILIMVLTPTAGGTAYYYYGVKTLMLSEIVGQTEDSRTEILINLFDFDTGLTRYDVHNLKSKSGYWQERMDYVKSIRDPLLHKRENEKLMAEMMQDPSMKKIIRKIFGFGAKTAYAILDAIF